ncbi:ABC transporter substrate-binding protein [Quadrisphaera sp. DSM 44207]|uniref:ABC transporter substrate-binding protein n=1 Tax=Quadrisphaera sp. DSM 44207 TaxID=1881057 RepID=UPI000882C0C4|nr:ABC transporter substrate-binding protein [Quadrisphaera sp. DSM 44207]SDQ19326.1 monosaccharide ABC transporter substrate-binding protein, CUT2 family [Quadrisphaera sp. DSM 44207]
MRPPASRARLALALSASALLLASCGGGEEEAAGSGEEALSVVYVPGLTGNPFYNTVGCGARDKAEELGVEFAVQGSSEFDVAEQTSIVNAVVSDAPDALMISVTDATAMQVPLLQAKEAGVDVITIDGDLEDKSIASSNIQSDNEAGGALAAEQLAQMVGEQGEVLAINQSPGNPIGEARERGFREKLAEYPGITYLGEQYAENQTARAASIASSAASSNPNLVGIYTMSTNNTEGAITGVREAGRTGEVKVVGYDTSEPILQALEDGNVDGIVVQYPYGEGALGVETAVALADGEEVEREQTVPFVFATPENQASEEVQQYVYRTDC